MSFSKNAEAVKTEDIPFWHVTYKGVVLPAFMTKEALDSMKSEEIISVLLVSNLKVP